MREGHGPIRQLRDLSWGAFDHASHGYASLQGDTVEQFYSSVLCAVCIYVILMP